MMQSRFWGVRGSVPSPLIGTTVESKIVDVLLTAQARGLPANASREAIAEWLRQEVSFESRSTYGGNTTCVEVRCGDFPIVLDMGTGIREFGNALMPQVIADKGVRGAILQSHLHWDHIQGFPFWKQVYMPRAVFNNAFTFYGGKEWDAHLEVVLAGQMDAPVFPVNLQELRHTAMRMDFASIWDGWKTEIATPTGDVIKVRARKLNHPQETFGYRIEYQGRSVVFTTDHEPYAAGVPNGLLDLVRDADVWITDCQYEHDVYTGVKGGVQRLGWGHSFPEYIAEVARAGKPGCIITTHHDPDANDQAITVLAQAVAKLSDIPTSPAYEGLSFVV